MRTVRGRDEMHQSLRQFPENHRLDYDHEYIIECSHSEQKYCLEVSGVSYPQTAFVFSLIRFLLYGPGRREANSIRAD
jgi:hypothetical protein